MAFGYVFYVSIINCENAFKLFRNILSVGCGFHAILHKNALSWIPQFRVQGLTMLYPILCYNGPQYNGARLYINMCVYRPQIPCYNGTKLYIYIYIYIYSLVPL